MGERITNTKIYGILSEMKTEISNLSLHIKGNGGKGILQRLDGIEKWSESRPVTCPATSDAVFKRIKRFTSIVGALLSVVLIVLVLGSRIMGDSKVEELKKQVIELKEAVSGVVP